MSWGCKIKLYDRDGMEKEIVISQARLIKDSREVIAELVDAGLVLSPNGETILKRYLTIANPKGRMRCVDKVGWHGSQYVMPHKIYNESPSDKLVLENHGLIARIP